MQECEGVTVLVAPKCRFSGVHHRLRHSQSWAKKSFSQSIEVSPRPSSAIPKRVFLECCWPRQRDRLCNMRRRSTPKDTQVTVRVTMSEYSHVFLSRTYDFSSVTYKTVSSHNGPWRRIQRPELSIPERLLKIVYRSCEHEAGHDDPYAWANITKEYILPHS